MGQIIGTQLHCRVVYILLNSDWVNGVILTGTLVVLPDVLLHVVSCDVTFFESPFCYFSSHYVVVHRFLLLALLHPWAYDSRTLIPIQEMHAWSTRYCRRRVSIRWLPSDTCCRRYDQVIQWTLPLTRRLCQAYYLSRLIYQVRNRGGQQTALPVRSPRLWCSPPQLCGHLPDTDRGSWCQTTLVRTRTSWKTGVDPRWKFHPAHWDCHEYTPTVHEYTLGGLGIP